MAYKNKEDQALCAKQHYERNKEKIKERAIRHRKVSYIRNKEFVNNYLLNNPCVDCGESDIVVLEFDHVKEGKFKNISDMIQGYSLDKIKLEISKCEVRCANCHRRITHQRRLTNRDNTSGL